MTVLRQALRQQTYGFLLIPGAIAVGFVLLAFGAVTVDHAIDAEIAYAGDAAGARTVLASIGGSLITVAGLAFSITIVTLQLVSSQFSPRAIRDFLSDRTNQATAGIFVGIFAYCLLVMGSVREATGGGSGFVPSISVSLALVLAMFALAVLLVFIHHMSQSIQASTITSRIASETLQAVDRVHPDDHGSGRSEDGEGLVAARRREEAPAIIHAARPGLVQAIALDDIASPSAPDDPGGNAHAKGGRLLHVVVRAGDFVTERTAIVEHWPAGIAPEELNSLRRTIRIREARDLEQDVAFGIRQLVDIALRAISPAVNDPTTALTCVGYVRAIMERLAGRTLEPIVIRDDEARLTTVAAGRTFEEYVDEAFSELGRYGASDVRVAGGVLMAIEATADAAARARAPGRVRVLVDLAEEIALRAMADATPRDSSELGARLDDVRRHVHD